MGLTKTQRIASWTLQVSVAAILFQTLFFKFTGAEESVYIFLTLGVIGGAILSHFAKLGIVVRDNGGLLFRLALVVFAGSAIVLFLRRREIPVIGAGLYA